MAISQYSGSIDESIQFYFKEQWWFIPALRRYANGKIFESKIEIKPPLSKPKSEFLNEIAKLIKSAKDIKDEIIQLTIKAQGFIKSDKLIASDIETVKNKITQLIEDTESYKQNTNRDLSIDAFLKKLQEDFKKKMENTPHTQSNDGTTEQNTNENSEDLVINAEKLNKRADDLRKEAEVFVKKTLKITENMEELNSEQLNGLKEIIQNLKKETNLTKEKTQNLIESVEKSAEQLNLYFMSNSDIPKDNLRNNTKNSLNSFSDHTQSLRSHIQNLINITENFQRNVVTDINTEARRLVRDEAESLINEANKLREIARLSQNNANNLLNILNLPNCNNDNQKNNNKRIIKGIQENKNKSCELINSIDTLIQKTDELNGMFHEKLKEEAIKNKQEGELLKTQSESNIDTIFQELKTQEPKIAIELQTLIDIIRKLQKETLDILEKIERFEKDAPNNLREKAEKLFKITKRVASINKLEELRRDIRISIQDQNGINSKTQEILKQNVAYNYPKIDQYIKEIIKLIIPDEKFVTESSDRELILEICKNIDLESNWYKLFDKYEFYHSETKSAETYDSLGFFGFRVRFKGGQPSFIKKIKPLHMQSIIISFHRFFIDLFKDYFKFDESLPYIFSISDEYDRIKNGKILKYGGFISWDDVQIKEKRKAIGDWVEIFSGQFEDYNDALYERRTKDNISNRKSELHLIMRNSGFIYMNPDNYRKYFIRDSDTPNSTGYMYENVCLPLAKMRTLLFGILRFNDVIDEDTQTLATTIKGEIEPEKIKEDLDYTLRLQNTLQNVISPFLSDISQNHRQHYSRIIKHALELFQINEIWTLIEKKMDSNQQALNNIYMEKQRETSERQEKITERQGAMLTLLQLILGTGVVFDIYVDTIDSRPELRVWVMVTLAIIEILAIGRMVYLYQEEMHKKTSIMFGILCFYPIYWVITYIMKYVELAALSSDLISKDFLELRPIELNLFYYSLFVLAFIFGNYLVNRYRKQKSEQL